MPRGPGAKGQFRVANFNFTQMYVRKQEIKPLVWTLRGYNLDQFLFIYTATIKTVSGRFTQTQSLTKQKEEENPEKGQAHMEGAAG